VSNSTTPKDLPQPNPVGRNLLRGLILVTCLGWIGCSSAPSRVVSSSWDPEGMAERAISELDSNGDGKLSMEELSAAPGLKYCAKQLDENGDGDGSLNHEEIAARLALYKEMRVALSPFDCTLILNKKPLIGAKVRLVPETFLGDIFPPLESTSEKYGRVDFSAEGIPMSVVPVGMYRVEVTSSDVDIPAQYNTKTTLGVEVSAITDPYHSGEVVFEMRNK
jgi:hypothetical protein